MVGYTFLAEALFALGYVDAALEAVRNGLEIDKSNRKLIELSQQQWLFAIKK